MLLFLAAALAGPRSEIAVTVDRPVAVIIDGQMMEYEEGTTRVVLRGASPGRHVVEIRNMVGKKVGEGMVELPARGDAVARVMWAGGVFSVVDVVSLEPEAPPSTAPASTTTTTITTGFPVFPLGATIVVTETTTPAPPAVPAARTVTFRSVDQEWGSVYVDGKRVWEIRVGEPEKTLTLATGVHTVEVKDFMESATWTRCRLNVSGATDLVIGVQKESALEVYNDPGACAGW